MACGLDINQCGVRRLPKVTGKAEHNYYAMSAAPKIPNLSGLSCFLTVGGFASCQFRQSNPMRDAICKGSINLAATPVCMCALKEWTFLWPHRDD